LKKNRVEDERWAIGGVNLEKICISKCVLCLWVRSPEQALTNFSPPITFWKLPRKFCHPVVRIQTKFPGIGHDWYKKCRILYWLQKYQLTLLKNSPKKVIT
jgi:hypothetical protein